MKHLVNFLKNRIWFIAVAVLLVLLTAQGCAGLRQNAVALEQSARCGVTEHVHTGECYMDELLVCGKSAHSHGENCYIFRVSDNDLNAILTDMGEKDIRSLEDYIAHNLAAVYGEGQDVDEYLRYTSVEELNAKLSTTGAKALRLNAAADLDAGIATMSLAPELGQLDSLGTSPTNSNNKANFYIHVTDIDGNSDWVCIGNTDVEVTRNYYIFYTATTSTTDAINLFNAAVDFNTPLAYNSNGFALRYSRDAGTVGGTGTQASIGNNNITFEEDDYSGSANANANAAKYVWWPDTEFYVVAFDYLDESKDTYVIVKSGDSVTLPTVDSNRGWKLNGTGTLLDGGAAQTITSQTVFVESSKLYTVRWVDEDGTTLETDSDLTSGTIPQYNDSKGTTTELAAAKNNAQYTYTFAGWTPAISAVTQDTTYTATYTKTTNTYTVIWKNDDGTVLETDTVAYGTTPTYDGTRGSTDALAAAKNTVGKTYTFTGWTPAVETVTGDAVYTATYSSATAKYTVTFNSNGGSEVSTQTVAYNGKATDPGVPGQRTGYSFAGWYLGDTLYDFSTAVTGDITLMAKWEKNNYNVTFVDGSSGEIFKTWTMPYESTITLPEVVNGLYWQLEGGGTYAEGDSYTVTGDATFTSTDKVCATYIYKNGSTATSDAVTPGTAITLPAASSTGNVWVGSDGVTYQPDATVTLNENMTFTERTTLTVSYDVNFPTSEKADGSYYEKGGTVTIPASPTLAGTTVTTISDTITEGFDTSIRNITETLVRADVPTHQSNFGYVFYFSGWETADGTVIPAGSTLSSEMLESYADENGVVELTGIWDYGAARVANFCINYASKLVSGALSDQYTKSLYSTYVGGTAKNSDYTVARANTVDEILGVDTTIRSLYGAHDQEVWLYSLPSDDLIFDGLIAELGANKVLTVEDETVLAENLTSEYYTIRWTAFFYEPWGGWHIDGVLVKKEGQIFVDKVFGGIEDAVNQARDGFYILAENGYKDANGDFVAYGEDDSAYNAHVLVLDDATATTLQGQYPNAIFQTYNTQDINSDGEIDKWLITGVELGEYWRFTEYAVHPTNADGKKYSWYAEYSVTDTDGEQSAIAQFGSIARVIGKTYALDEDPDQGLSIKFTNYYYANDSILVRKIDSGTGTPLGNAVFELWQPTTKGGESVKLRFNDDGNGVYTLSETGDKDTITTNAEGFSVITITGFSFEAGPLTVKEVVPPSGYDPVNPVTVHYLNGESGEVGVTDIASIAPTRYAEFAEYYVDERTQGGVIVVKDHTAYEASVTVNKIWENPSYIADSVTVVLQATVNGVTQNAGALFPNLTGHQQVLSAANNWTYTWTGLPAYANGELVSWGIKEIKVGSDPTLSDGVSFASWVPSYSPASCRDSDGNGIVDSWSVSVTNSQKRPMVNIYKTDSTGTYLLEGATFTLEKVQWNNDRWEQVPDSLSLSQTSDANGWLIFDNLTPSSADSAVFYRLTETSPPPGYTKAAESVVFTVDGLGNIYGAADGAAGSSLLDTEYVDFYSRYYLTVRNEAMPEFPETGGDGNDIYAHLGALLMLAAAAAVIYKKTKGRKEDDASAV